MTTTSTTTPNTAAEPATTGDAHAPARAATAAGTRRTRASTGLPALLALLVLGTVGERILGFWHPSPDAGEEFSYAYLSAHRDTWWAMHFFGAVAVTVQAVALSLLVWLLARGRSPRWALTGGLLTSLGALLFSVGIAAEGVLYAYAADPSALPPATGATFLHHVESGGGRYLAGILPGLALSTLGPLVLAVALWRSRAVPRWLPALLVAGTVAGNALPFGIVGGVVSTLTLTPGILLVGWFARRSPSTALPVSWSRSSAASPAPTS